MRVGVLGVNHKLADLELREILAKTCQRRLSPGQSLHGEHTFLLLSTCNRTEVYFSSEDLAASHSYLLNILRSDVCDDFDQKLYSYFGSDCLQHLSRVAAGLDSAIVAETEIQGQVKTAYEMTQEHHRLPYELHYLFQKALGIAKKVRTSLPLAPGLPDIEHAVFSMGQHLFKKSSDMKVLFIGASDINEKVLKHLVQKGLTNVSLCNRTKERGHQLSKKYGVGELSWNELNSWIEYDWIILGTKAPQHLISSSELPKSIEKKKLIIDLSVPRNAEPALASHSGVTLFNIDQLNRHLQIRNKKMMRSLLSAEELIETLVTRQLELFMEKEQHRLKFCLVSA
jgi:glutamyl-tRNA reductase